jgi:hypothetical protein
MRLGKFETPALSVTIENYQPSRVQEAWISELVFLDKTIDVTFNGFNQRDVVVAINGAIEKKDSISNVAFIAGNTPEKIVIPTRGLAYYVLREATYSLTDKEFEDKIAEGRLNDPNYTVVDYVREIFEEDNILEQVHSDPPLVLDIPVAEDAPVEPQKAPVSVSEKLARLLEDAKRAAPPMTSPGLLPNITPPQPLYGPGPYRNVPAQPFTTPFLVTCGGEVD